MSYRLSGINPLAYIGVEPLTPPAMIVQPRSPTSGDSKGYNLGSLWLVAAPPPTQNWELWLLVDLTAGIATWVQLYPDSAAGVIRLDADVGFAIPTAGIINVLGGENINTFGDMANNLFINLNESIRLPNTSSDGSQGVLFLGAVGGVGGDTFLHNYGSDNTFLGQLAGNLTLNVGLASANTGIGNNSLRSLTTGALNSALGEASLLSLTTGDANVSLGSSSLQNLVSGNNNISLGVNSSQNYNGAESSNIIIGNDGVLGESNTIRIGTDGIGDGQQDAAYMAGIYGRSVGGTNQTVIVDNTGKLGSTTNPIPGGIIITQFDSSGTWTKNPNTQMVEFYIWNGGSGGGSGSQGPQNSAGGAGGGSAGSFRYIKTFGMFAGASQVITVGTGGAGGAPVNSPNTNGNPGAAGTASGVGTLFMTTQTGISFIASYGLGGSFNGATATGGFSTVTLDDINMPNRIGSAGSFINGIRQGGSASNHGQYAKNSTGAQQYPLFYGPHYIGGSGGGGGGASNSLPNGGGHASDFVDMDNNFVIYLGALGGASDSDGAIGAPQPTTLGIVLGGGGGGGGGGMTTVRAGNGGNGAVPGGGGGGGGASVNGTISGAGGNGADGLVIVVEYL